MTYLEVQKNKHINNAKKASYTVVCFFVLSIFIATSDGASAAGRATIITDTPYNLCITTAENKCREYGESDKYAPTGNMALYKNDSEYSYTNDDTGMWMIETDDSKRFEFKTVDGSCLRDFYADIKSSYHRDKIVRAIWCKRVVFTESGIDIIAEKGSTCTYNMGLFSSVDKKYYNVAGDTENDVALLKEGTTVILKGGYGKTEIVVCKGKDNHIVLDRIYAYLYGKSLNINTRKSKLSIKGGILIPKRIERIVTGLYLRPSNNGNNMFLSWNKVKGAKSYIVYRYSPEKGRYVAVAVRDGKSANYHNIPKAVAGMKYKYKIVAKTKHKGKGKKVCKDSYAVTAVAQGSSRANAGKVTTSRKKITGKIGKQIKLKAKIETAKEQAESSSESNGAAKLPLLSENIRWYTSDSKIARVDKHSGKVILKKKGRCLIWAKAHNGRNSRPIKVVVKGIAGS